MNYIEITEKNTHELAGLLTADHISLDTETTGLRPFHGDTVFAITICDGTGVYYLERLPRIVEDLLEKKTLTVFLHNAKFDCHSLWNTYGIMPEGLLWDTMVGARVAFNDHLEYNLAACAERIGFSKDDAVEEYIKEHKLWEWVDVPGKKQRKKNKFFSKVPHDIMFNYACRDAEITYKLGMHQIKLFQEQGKLLSKNPGPMDIMVLEQDVTRALWQMEDKGLKIDGKFVDRAINYEENREETAKNIFKFYAGCEYQASPILFQKIFADERPLWKFTEKGNPSFESDAIKKFVSPVAKEVLRIRDAKSRMDFYRGFSFYTDAKGYVHPSFNQAGTRTGRFSSSEPNFQNLTNEDESQEEFKVRSAIIPPSKKYAIVSIDYDQQEYRMMLDYAGEMGVIEQVKSGVDVHQATANIMGVSRKEAKTVNFLLLYGGGALKLANELGRSEAEARELRHLYFTKLPRVQKFIRDVIGVAETRGYIINWAGRRYYFTHEHAYKAPNTLIQGGGSDVMRYALVKVTEHLRGKKSYPCLTVHDELDFYVHQDELYLISEIREIMENVYPSRHLKLTCSLSHSWRSLGDLKDGAPDYEARDGVSKQPSSPIFEDPKQLSLFSHSAGYDSGRC